MVFITKKLQSQNKRMSFIKGATLFFLGMSFVLFVVNAFEVTPIASNAIQYIGKIFLTTSGDNLSSVNITIDGATGGGITIANLTSALALGTNSSGKIIALSSGTVYNFISGYALSGPTGAVGATGAGGTGNGSPWETGSGTYSVQVIGDGTNHASGNYSVVGGQYNTGLGNRSVIVGGLSNIIKLSGHYSFIGGGSGNMIRGNYTIVGGGLGNVGSGNQSFVGGGSGNVSDGTGSVVVGGISNSIGRNNVASNYSFMGGGSSNRMLGDTSVIVGGFNNYTQGKGMFLGGGSGNTAISDYSVVGGGEANVAYNFYTSILGGRYNTVRTYASVIVGGDHNYVQQVNNSNGYSFIGGGSYNTGEGEWASIVGGSNNMISLAGEHSFIGGGRNHYNSGYYSFIGGGDGNITTGAYSFVGGGTNNSGGGNSSVIGGGGSNSAPGAFATVPGGVYNTASGTESFAAGVYAYAWHDNTFVWNDQPLNTFSSTNTGQFLIHASNGVGIGTASPTAMLTVDGGIRPKKRNTDPCADTVKYPEGTQFYNDTNNYYCFCDTTTTAKGMTGANCY